jgi:copper homeostasis protein
MRPPIIVEACVDSVASCMAAERGGAHRVELCDALFDGGTTPSAGMIAACKEAVAIPVFVIIRPRGGGFVYSDAERDVMKRDITIAREIGADGVVLGGLNHDGSVDDDLVRELMDVAYDLPVTFHRAFDFTPDLNASLEMLIGSGVQRVLTSGGAPSGVEGAEKIADLVRVAGSRIIVMAGGSVREQNVRDVVATSGVMEVHVRLTRLVHDTLPENGLRLRKPFPENDGDWEETDVDRIRDLMTTINA